MPQWPLIPRANSFTFRCKLLNVVLHFAGFLPVDFSHACGTVTMPNVFRPVQFFQPGSDSGTSTCR